ncbi:MAG: hypothetical protein M5U34_31840 [Chloroflexi bacterium]|nr:hypothetical protein [Chloroflexota bacterium]
MQEINGDITLRVVSGEVNVKQGSRDINLNQIEGALYLAPVFTATSASKGRCLPANIPATPTATSWCVGR